MEARGKSSETNILKTTASSNNHIGSSQLVSQQTSDVESELKSTETIIDVKTSQSTVVRVTIAQQIIINEKDHLQSDLVGLYRRRDVSNQMM